MNDDEHQQLRVGDIIQVRCTDCGRTGVTVMQVSGFMPERDADGVCLGRCPDCGPPRRRPPRGHRRRLDRGTTA